MGKKYRTSYQIPFYESDINHHVKLPHILSIALQIASDQSVELGLGDERIFKDYNLVWVVSEHEVIIDRLPQFNEIVEIETEPLSYNRYFCYREFRIYDKKGEKMMTIFSTFVLMDYDTRKVHEVPEDLIAPYESEKIRKILRGPKYRALEKAAETLYHVRYFDLDVNGHVNNSRYLEWMYDVLDFTFLKTHIPQKINLKYVKEIQYGNDIASRWEQDGLITKHEITSNGQLNAQAITQWEEV
ncbi:acyl-ACP thioesterase domain-containing protein [Streptococcus macacae]|uniref:Acyl-ACP thioesterase n=1 Tax=Streptococcus macacae NCTC 11558 TaxID=764298 RepID=G5JVK4_9STRE|nr:acyl-ACP thioesterase domain-containing protein [Streptococcus macacae]EHJ52132.1 acyl-ACP thioesterase [Streptococcus macacae NCTC 11558]SUN78673.1 oleoyl-acyl carrier protein thioesterase [Streptococcus macacae NCTC 11558]